jgi:hypothetical protein
MTLALRHFRPQRMESVDETPGLMSDRRRYRRVAIALIGRFMRASKLEYPCKLIEMSVGGASMMAPVAVDPGERIIVYFDHVGGLSGHVVRAFEDGFAMRFDISAHKREKLAAQLTWLINRKEFEGIEEREHERLPVDDRQILLHLPGGRSLPCGLGDISISGASILTTARPPIGTEVGVGLQRAVVRRHHETGIGVQFLMLQEPSALQTFLE